MRVNMAKSLGNVRHFASKLYEGVSVFVMRRHRAYVATFIGVNGKPHPNAEIVLKDLRKYCGVDHEGITVSPVLRMTDPFATSYRAGRRDVYLRIERMLRLPTGALNDDNSSDSSST